jgi:hypothetical protein
MAPSTETRQVAAQRIAAILYGVIGIMTAELSLQVGEFGYAEAAFGALFVGLAMMTTRLLVEVVKKETEIGAHLPLHKAGEVLRDSVLVMLFPTVTAVMIVIAGATTARWEVLLDVTIYIGVATVFCAGFLSSYLLHHAIVPALARGSEWLLLSLLLLAAKRMA